MIFSRSKILTLLASGAVTISPFNEDQLNVNSYNLTVGGWAYFVKLNEEGQRIYYGPKLFAHGDKIPMPWGVGILGVTREYIATKGPMIAQLRARSTTGREFFTVCADAGLGDIGYCNYWTCEFSNHLRGTAWLEVGSEFGQIVFQDTTEENIDYSGQYTGAFPECMVPKKYRPSIKSWCDRILFS